jgi:hypothetical protein
MADNKCPVCGEMALSRCKCPRADSRCKFGHQWHTCAKHNKIVLGLSNHSIPTFDCTCGEEFK